MMNFVAKLFSFRHKGTKTLRKNNEIKFFVSLCLGGKYFWFPDKSGFSLRYNRRVRMGLVKPIKLN